MTNWKYVKAALGLGILATTTMVTGCTSKEVNDTLASVETALSDLTQNRALAEQFVRDLKSGLAPSDPNYEDARNSYEDARDAYNRFLDTAEDVEKPTSARSLKSSDAELDARNATAEFLADATAALKPDAKTRHIPFARAVAIPENIGQSLRKLPKRERERLISRFDRQVRWRSWGQL